MWGKAHIVVPARFPSQMKAKGKRHVSFPFCRLYPHETSLQAVSSVPRLTLTMPAAIALAAALLVDHRVTAALGTEIARHA